MAFSTKSLVRYARALPLLPDRFRTSLRRVETTLDRSSIHQEARRSARYADCIILTGQMRSGTTMMASFLNAQDNIRFLPDTLRVSAASLNIYKRPIDPEKELTERERRKMFISMTHIGSAPAAREEERALFQRWKEKGGLPEFSNQTELYLVLWEELRRDLKATGRFGTKITRGERLAKSLASYGAKSILILRDPRAVFTSQVARAAKDPNFPKADIKRFVTEWRQSFDNWANPGKMHALRYEDFVTGDRETERLSRYLGLRLDPNARIKTSNSSFGDQSTGARRLEAVERWKEQGNLASIAYIEGELESEMIRAGYF